MSEYQTGRYRKLICTLILLFGIAFAHQSVRNAKGNDSSGSISGRVTRDSDGDGIPASSIHIYDLNWGLYKSGIADSSGYYSVTGIPPGSYFVAATNSYGFIRYYCNVANYHLAAPVAVSLNTDTSNINFLMMSSDASISGRIYDDINGVGISDVDIQIYGSDWSLVYSSQTNSSGYYSIDGLASGSYYIKTSNTSGYNDEYYSNADAQDAATPVTVVQHTAYGINFGLASGGSISGRVTRDSDGAGIPGVFVRIYNTGWIILASYQTDSSGYYHANNLPAGSYYLETYNTLNYSNEYYNNAVSRSDAIAVTVLQGADTPVDIALISLGSISGRITSDSHGSAISGVAVNLYNSNMGSIQSVSTDASGNYILAGLAAGQYCLRTSNALGYVDEYYDNAISSGSRATITVPSGTAIAGIDFSLAIGGSISGKITRDSDGSGMNRPIAIYNSTGGLFKSGIANSAGNYSVTGLPAGSYYVVAYNTFGRSRYYRNVAYYYAATAVEVMQGADTANIDFIMMSSGASISGRVYSDKTGAGISDVDVQIYDSGWNIIKNGQTNLSGYYSIDGLEPGSYYIKTLNTSGYNDEYYSDVAVQNAATPVAIAQGADIIIDIRLGLGGSISGRVTRDSDGSGISGVYVNIYDTSWNLTTSVPTDSLGYYSAKNLESGSYYLGTHQNSDYVDEYYDNAVAASDAAAVTVVQGADTNIDISLIGLGSISGRIIRGSDGEGISGVTVQALYSVSGRPFLMKSAITDSSGYYSLTGLSPNGYQLHTYNSYCFVDEWYPQVLHTSLGSNYTDINFNLSWGGLSSVGGFGSSLDANAKTCSHSSVMGFQPILNDFVDVIAVQNDGKILIGGAFTQMGGGGFGQSPYSGVIFRNRIARIYENGALDESFDPGANDLVSTIAVQSDGKILVGGSFTTLGGGGIGITSRNYLGRLNPDGSLDESFDPGANGLVSTIAVQNDGKILVGGSFTALGGGGTGAATRNHIGRLNPDGTLDSSFNPGASGEVSAIVVQPDGKILVGGSFANLGGGIGTTVRNHIGRLNPDGSLDADFNPGANGRVISIALQPDGKILAGGSFTALGGGGTGSTTRNYVGRLNENGTIDTSFDPGSNSSVYTLAIQKDGKILVGGGFSAIGGGGTGNINRDSIARLNGDGSLDMDFDADCVYGGVSSITLQADGKILAGGTFSGFKSRSGESYGRSRIGRLNPDGTVDNNYMHEVGNSVGAIARQADGKVVVGGLFPKLGTANINKIGRFNPDGSLDSSFNPGVGGNGNFYRIEAILIQPDGKIVVGGNFTRLGGGGTGSTTRNNLGRLNEDGSLDDTFDPGANDTVWAMALQPDGKILVGGYFTALGGGTGTASRSGIGRLNADGTVDESFNPGDYGVVSALAVQPDGKILVGVGGGSRHNIYRLNPDGSLDESFYPGANGGVLSIALQPDGKVLVGGEFTALGGTSAATPRNYIGRLNSDGTVDESFNPGADPGADPENYHAVSAIVLQADGKILAGGAFSVLTAENAMATRFSLGRWNSDGTLDASFDPGTNGSAGAVMVQPDGTIVVGGWFQYTGNVISTINRFNLMWLTNPSPANQTLRIAAGGSAIQWQRSGASPEVDSVTFEQSTDGLRYSILGSADRVSGGWRLSGLSLPENQKVYIRARGYYTAGGGSQSIAESVLQVYLSPSVNDFDADNNPDILWRNASTGEICVWFMDEANRGGGGSLQTVADPNRKIAGMGDFNGDGKSDILWRNTVTGENVVWYMDGMTKTGEGSIPSLIDPQWKIAGMADFNGDGKPDILWRNASAGDNFVWYMDGTVKTGGESLNAVTDLNWQIEGLGDFNGDGFSDILWRNGLSGDNYIWFMNKTIYTGGASLDAVADTNWNIAGIGDYSGDGQADILWRNASTGENRIWRMDGTAKAEEIALEAVSDTNWLMFDKGKKARNGADFDHNGNADIVLRNETTGENVAWIMNGASRTSEAYLDTVADPTWKIVGAGDFNGDGRVDLLWRNISTGDNYIWYMDGTSHTGGASLDAVADPNWNIVGVGDFNGNGKVDLLWRNEATGENYLWSMNGTVYMGGISLDTAADLNWKIIGVGDFDSDGKVDILWRNAATGEDRIWLMDGTIRLSEIPLEPVADLNWRIASIGDYNKDGMLDLLWQNKATGEICVWFMNRSIRTSGRFLDVTADSSWIVAP